MLIAFPIGILSALRPILIDRGAMIFILIGISAPVVWIGLLLQYFVGFKWDDPERRLLRRLHPPEARAAVARGLGLPHDPSVDHVRDPVRRELRADDPRERDGHARRGLRPHGPRKGAPENVVIRTHVLRNALLPVVTMLGLDIGIALGGAIFTEAIFGLPGLGRLALNSVLNLDLPTMQGVVVFATLAIILLNLIVDIIYA